MVRSRLTGFATRTRLTHLSGARRFLWCVLDLSKVEAGRYEIRPEEITAGPSCTGPDDRARTPQRAASPSTRPKRRQPLCSQRRSTSCSATLTCLGRDGHRLPLCSAFGVRGNAVAPATQYLGSICGSQRRTEQGHCLLGVAW